MTEENIDIKTADGLMNTFVVYPEEGGPYPVIFFYMDAPGKREELHDMARRLATVGYYVLLPNLYYREVREFNISKDNQEQMMGLMKGLSHAMVVRDTQTMMDHVASQKKAKPGKMGCVGYCMSGPFAFNMASVYPDVIAAAASFHGVRLFVDAKDSPHRAADKIKGELYIGCAENDSWAPKEMIDSLDKHLAQTGIKYRIEWYHEALHGFVFPQRGRIYHKESAERHWERLFDLFARNLG